MSCCLKKNPVCGGALKRFLRDGLSWDSGFHFTGGIQPDELLYQMLQVLGVESQVLKETALLKKQYYFETQNLFFEFPPGIPDFTASLKNYFPKEVSGIDRFIRRIVNTVESSKFMDIHSLLAGKFEFQDADSQTLQEVLDDCFKDPLIKTIYPLKLSAMARHRLKSRLQIMQESPITSSIL